MRKLARRSLCGAGTETCPGCKRDLQVTYYDICTRREAKCRRCGASLKFDSGPASALHAALRDLELAEEKVAKSLARAVDTAAVTAKR